MNFFKVFITFINIPRFLIHLLFFEIFNKRCLDDVIVGIKHHGISLPTWLGFVYLLTFSKTYRNIFYFRIGVFKYLIYYWAPPHNSFVIATHSKIGNSFLGIHPIGTFVNAKNIGNHFTVKNNVTIGRNGEYCPTIKDNVTINSNAVVVGNIIIGNNVIVGAGTVLMKNVPDNCVVVGNPARILRKDGVRIDKAL